MKKKGLGNNTKKFFEKKMQFIDVIETAMNNNPRHAAILKSRLRGDSMKELADEYSISAARISQIENQALKKMKKFISLF